MTAVDSSTQPKKAWLVLSTMFILMVLVDLDYTAVNLALVAISQDVESDLNTLQWLLSGYVLAWSGFVAAAGKLSDIYGKRTILLWGVWGFLISSALCALAQSDLFLILARGLQGLNGALFVPPVYTLVFSSFPENKRGFAIGILGIGVGLGLALGPSFSGLILDYFSWRWIFWVNVPLCALVILKTHLFVDKALNTREEGSIHIPTSILLFIGLVTLMFGLNQVEVWGVFSPLLWGVLAASLLCLLIFHLYSKKVSSPLIPRGLFKNRSFLACCSGYGLFQFTFSLVLVLLTLYLQNVKGYSPKEAGLAFLPLTVLMGALSPFGGKLCDRTDVRWPLCGGAFLSLFAFILCARFTASTSETYLLISLSLFGVSFGLALASFNAVMLKTVSGSILSTASGVFTMIACLGCTSGTVMGTSLLVGLASHQFDQMGSLVDEGALAALKSVFAEAHWDYHLFSESSLAIEAAADILKTTFSDTFGVLMFLGAGVSLLSFFICWFGLSQMPSPSQQS